MNINIPSIRLLNCPIHAITMEETVSFIDKSIKARKQIHHVVVNAAKLVKMKSDNTLRESVVNCDIINADGQSLVWAARLLGLYLPERVAGIDLMERLVLLAYYKGYKIYFLGAQKEVVSALVEKYVVEFDKSIIAGYRDGYFKKEEEPEVAKAIRESNAHILFVAMSSPKKEIFLNTYKELINTPFIMGVGGSFDVIAGKVKRAPLWMQQAGLEWFYRVIQEPGRMWKRYLVTNTLFIGRVFNAVIKKHMSF